MKIVTFSEEQAEALADFAMRATLDVLVDNKQISSEYRDKFKQEHLCLLVSENIVFKALRKLIMIGESQTTVMIVQIKKV